MKNYRKSLIIFIALLLSCWGWLNQVSLADTCKWRSESKIVNYMVATTPHFADPEKFSIIVRELIREGWSPIGGIAVDSYGYYQAMIKQEE